MTNEERVARQKMIVAMDYIANCINDEDIQYGWLMNGVPDGMLNDSLDPTQVDDEDWMINEGFKEIMTCFLRLMTRAYNDGGLECGGEVSCDRSDDI